MIWLVNIFIYSFVFLVLLFSGSMVCSIKFVGKARLADSLHVLSHTLSRCSRSLLARSHSPTMLSLSTRALSLSHDALVIYSRSLALSLRNSRLTRRGRITIGNHSPHLTTLLAILSCIAAPRHWTKAAKPYSLWRNSQIFF